MKPTTIRIIIAAVFAAVSISIDIMVWCQWSDQGCAVKSLILAVAFYTSCLVALWYAIDASIKEANN